MRVILASPEAKVWSARKHIPLGLGYLAAVLREGGHDVMIYDAAVEDVGVEYYLEVAAEEGRPYDLIGVTATTPLMPEAWEMAELCKARALGRIKTFESSNGQTTKAPNIRLSKALGGVP